MTDILPEETIIKCLRNIAQRNTAMGTSEPEEHTCWIAADIIETKNKRIAELKTLLKPFASLNAHWFGDPLPLQPKSIPVEPLPVLYASKYFSEPEK